MARSQLLINLSFLIRRPTGISTYSLNLLPHLQALSPTLLACQPIDSYPYYPNYPIPAGLTPEQGLIGHLRRLGWTQWQLPRLYQRLQANLLFSPLPEAPLTPHCRFVVTVHDLIPLRFRQFSPLKLYYRYYVPQVLAQAQHVICNSQTTANDLIDRFGIRAAKITPIPLAYDSNQFYPLPNTQVGNYFLYIGRHDPYKNLHRLIEAFAALPRKQNDQLWLAGSADPRYTPHLQRQVEELNLSAQVKFLGYVSAQALPRLVNEAIALVFPSLWEGFGLPVLEAMACGTPVITANISALREVAGEAAILINPYNTRELTDALLAVATDSALRSRLSQLGLERASQFSWAKTGQATVAILKQFL